MAYVAIVPYADETYGTAYHGERLGTDFWDNASSADRVRALKEATRLMDLVPLVGQKYEEDQVREFPRDVDDDGVVPTEIQDACCEVALALLQGRTFDQLSSSIGIASESTGDASVSYTGDRGALALSDEFFGLPSPTAASLMAPWIEDTSNIDLTRV